MELGCGLVCSPCLVVSALNFKIFNSVCLIDPLGSLAPLKLPPCMELKPVKSCDATDRRATAE